jgi:rod shape-determining protein MreD
MAALLRFLLGLVAATTLLALGQHVTHGFASWFDPFLVLTIYQGLRHGPAASALGGTATGLLQDTLTAGLFGLHGFANTAVGYLVSWVRQRFVIQQPAQVGILCFLAAAFQTLLLALLQVSMVADGELPDPWSTLIRMTTTGILGAVVFDLAGRLFEWERRWRERRGRRLRLD